MLNSQNFIKQVITDILTIPFAKPTSAFFKATGLKPPTDQYLQHWLETRLAVWDREHERKEEAEMM